MVHTYMTETKPEKAGMRNVTSLGAVSFFTDFSTEMILGVLPLFIISNLGATRAILGAIEGSGELAGYAFRMVSGSLSDKIGKRKVFIIAGYALSTASKPFFAFASGWVDALVVRLSDRVGKGFRTAPRDALIADSVSESSSGKAFGLHRTLDQAGAIIGPLAAFALLSVTDIRGVFLFSLIPGAVAVLILLFFVKEVAIKTSARKTMLSNIKGLVRENKPYLFLLIIAGIFSVGAFNFSFVLLRASEMGVDNNMVPMVYAVINIVHTVIAYPSGMLADKIGGEKVLIIGYAIFAASAAMMAMLGGILLYAYVIAAVFGAYVGITETLQRAVIPKYVPQESRGTAFGLYNLVVGFGFFGGGVAFGLLWDLIGIATASAYSIILAIVSIIGMVVFVMKKAK
jgi:MFS family permease